MPEPPVVGGARAVVNYIQHGQERATVLHYKKAVDFTLSELTNLAAQLLVEFTSSTWRNQAPINLLISSIVTTSMRGSASEQATAPCVTNCAGVNATAPAPGNVTSTISWRTAGIGRSKRGRSFLPGMLDADTNDDDTVASVKLTQLGAMAARIYNAGSTSFAALGVYSRTLDVITAVTAWVLENILDTQRRRLPGRGD